MRTIKILLILMCLPVFAISQDFENYQTLLSKGEMPEDFKLMASEKYKNEIEQIKKEKASKKDKKYKRNFALESNFAISDLMMSGRVIYGDVLSEYVNKIADILLKDDKELRNELRFYILKSTVANAFSTNQGMIFVTSGLIAQVENEAQLAFIIAHEIVHYTEKHNYETFKKKVTILKGSGRNSTSSIEDKIKSLYKFSRNNESEADKKGFEIFSKTNYNPWAAVTAFDVLLYSYLPYDMIEWKPTVFETKNYKFPEEYTSKELDEISADEEDDDKEKTHPNISKRKDKMISEIERSNADSTGKSLYLVSKSEFLKMQKIARFELASLYIKSANPAKAYYIAYLLDNTYGANKYTDKIKAMSLYSLAHHITFEDDLDDYGCNKHDYEGEVQQVARFFSKLKAKEFSVLASKYLWEMSVKYPQDKQLVKMRDQIFTDMLIVNNVSKNEILFFKPEITNDSSENIKGNSKVEKLKKKQKSQKSGKYYYAAFYEFQKDKSFKNYLSDINNATSSTKEEESDAEEEEEDIEYEGEKKSKTKKEGKTKKDKDKEHDKINSLVLFNPDYNANYNGKTYYLSDEATQNEITGYYKELATKLDFEIHILDHAGQENFNTEAFNKHALLNDWLIERISNDTLTMELYQKEFISSSLSDYNSKYLGWAGYKYTESRRPFNATSCAIAVICYPFIPLYLVWQLSSDKIYENLLLIYDVETGKPVLVDYKSTRKKPKNFIIKAIIYNQMYDLKNSK